LTCGFSNLVFRWLITVQFEPFFLLEHP
jgi:hypothetical protein